MCHLVVEFYCKTNKFISPCFADEKKGDELQKSMQCRSLEKLPLLEQVMLMLEYELVFSCLLCLARPPYLLEGGYDC